MHLIRSDKPQKQKPFIPIRHIFDVPDHRRVRGKRYAVGGKYLHDVGPKRRADPIEKAAVLKAQKAAAKLPPPEETGMFDLRRLTLLPKRVLVERGELIKQEKGIDLPEANWFYGPWFWVVALGPGVTEIEVGDRVIFQKNSIPREQWIGRKFYLGRASAVAAVYR